MQTSNNFKRGDDASGQSSIQGSGAADSLRKTLSERIVIAVLLIICCFAFASNLLR